MSPSRRLSWDHPRIRGEHFDLVGGGADDGGSSPHTRGARRRHRQSRLGRRIIPAYAGSTFKSSPPTPPAKDHPRIRGEHAKTMPVTIRHFGSSPHTRGAPRKEDRSVKRSRIIPAYAGSTLRRARLRRLSWDHPRIRGEHSQAAAIEATSPGSSPHTRGAQPPHRRRRQGRGIIPAYAGSTTLPSPARRPGRDHPRIRGEHVFMSWVSAPALGSSPHTRGARRWRCAGVRARGIIPAYAGSTLNVKFPRGWCRDHPRIRGEHYQVGVGRWECVGSSPRVCIGILMRSSTWGSIFLCRGGTFTGR